MSVLDSVRQNAMNHSIAHNDEVGPTMYRAPDFVAAALAIHANSPSWEAKYRREFLAVEYDGVRTKGQTVIVQEGPKGKIRDKMFYGLEFEERRKMNILTELNGTAIVELYRQMLAYNFNSSSVRNKSGYGGEGGIPTPGSHGVCKVGSSVCKITAFGPVC